MRTNQRRRYRARWISWGTLLGVEIAVWCLLARLATGWPADAVPVLVAASLPIPLALVLSTSRRLRGLVDPLLAHTISLAGLSALAAAVGVVLLLALDRVPTARERALLGLSMATAALAALLYVPLHARLSRLSARLRRGSREASDHALRAFAGRLSRAVPLEELLLQVAEALRDTMALDAAEVWTGSDGRLERVASMPDAPASQLVLSHEEEKVVAQAGVSGTAWARVWLPQLLKGRPDAAVRVAPVTHSARLLGLVVCARPPDAKALTDKEERVLTELVRQLGLVLHNVRLDAALQASIDELRHKADELQASRARIVSAADAGRRQIERDLHDGAQQHLVGLVAQLRLAVQVGRSDHGAAEEMLEELGRGLQEAVHQLRSLAHGIYPPLLVERGLPEALKAAATRAGVPAEVEANGTARYPPDLEAAVYFCCLEALQNAVKHAGPDVRVKVRVWEESGALLFDVTDDGLGFDPSERRHLGAGFTNMGDRVGAIGGSLGVQSALGRGTRVSGRVPLGR